jgi:hypothetical protein
VEQTPPSGLDAAPHQPEQVGASLLVQPLNVLPCRAAPVVPAQTMQCSTGRKSAWWHSWGCTLSEHS